MTQFKRISADGVDVALNKADQYRLLNIPNHAESICLDVLEVQPGHQRAVITLILALTDQFPSRRHDAHHDAVNLLEQLEGEYEKHYYEGIIIERWASTHWDRGSASRSVPEWLSQAMQCYERAEDCTNSENPDPILRWNACARLKAKVQQTSAAPAPLTRDIQSEFGDDVPPK